jgi:hypothetical protein
LKVLRTVAPNGHNDFPAMIEQQAALDALPPEIAEAAAHTESGFNPHVIGAVGEIGLMQISSSSASAGCGFDCGAGFAWRGFSGLDEKSLALRL